MTPLPDTDVRVDVWSGQHARPDRRVARATHLPTGLSVEVHRGQSDPKDGEAARWLLELLVDREEQAQAQRQSEEPAPFYPATVAQAVAHLRATTENLGELAEMDDRDLISLHHGFGRAIRNGMDLWGAQRNLPMETLPVNVDAWENYGGREKHAAAQARNPDLKLLEGPEPDHTSMTIVEELWRALREERA